MYDAVAGRFVSRDPIGFRGSQWGLYEFVKGNATLIVDPSGLAPGDCQDKHDECMDKNDWRDENCELNAEGVCFIACVVATKKCRTPTKVVTGPPCFLYCLEVYLLACRADSRIGSECCGVAKARCDDTGSWPGFLWRVFNGCHV